MPVISSGHAQGIAIKSCRLVQDLKEGDTIITVPLRLSFTDVDSKAEGPASNLPWPVRLAGRILGEYYTPQSPWRPYLHVCAARSLLQAMR